MYKASFHTGGNTNKEILIIIEQNIILTKSFFSRKNECTKFQVDSLVRSRDIVYTVWKNMFLRKTRLKYWY